MLSDSNPLPLYAQLAEALRHRIARGDWTEGDRLPTQDALTREFSVARVTVRQAITLLAQDGLVLSKQGRGTFVLARPGPSKRLQVQTSLRALVDMLRGDEPQMLNLVEAASIPRLTDRDGVAAPGYVFMRRVHLRRGTPYCVIAIHLDERIFRRAPERFRREVMLPILASLPGLTIARAHQRLTIGSADPETAEYLGIAMGAPVANVRRVFRNEEGTVVYLGEVIYRGDLVQLDMDLAP
jgi:GntR family transcriptional regulator